MKSILVHLDASPRSAERLALARALARLHGAELTVAYGVLPCSVAMPWVVLSQDRDAASMMLDIDQPQQARARALFDQSIGASGGRWLDASSEQLVAQLSAVSLYADLLVVGQHDDGDRLAGPLPRTLVADLIADSGKPVLVIPCAGSFDPDPRTVLIAWKPTREAARAATAALPWLARAHRVIVATGEDRTDDGDATLQPLVHWLRLNGVSATVERRRLAREDIGEDLLSLAADTDAGLLAMGCYGHHRAREWMLGGVTRTVLRSTTLPTLMVH